MRIPVHEDPSLLGDIFFVEQVREQVGEGPIMALCESNCGTSASAPGLLVKLVDFFVFLEDGNQSGEIAAMY